MAEVVLGKRKAEGEPLDSPHKRQAVVVAKSNCVLGKRKAEGEPCDSPYKPVTAVSTAVTGLSVIWFLLRAYRLTASVVATAIGLGEAYPKDLYWKITTCPLAKTDDNEAMSEGRRKEPFVILRFSEITKMPVEESYYRTDRELPWLGATPDGYIPHDTLSGTDGPALLECKAPFYRPYEHPPIKYVIQTYIQMRVEDLRTNYLAMYWDDGRCMRIWRIRWCDRVWMWIVTRMVLFMACVFHGVAPTKNLIPMLAEPCQTLVDQRFKKGLREKLAKEHGVAPEALIPDIPIDTLHYDPDPFRYHNGEKIRKVPLD